MITDHTLDSPEGQLQSPLLETGAAARYLQLRPGTLANWRTAGGGPRYVRVGRRPFYRQADLEAWLDTHLFEDTAAERGQERARQSFGTSAPRATAARVRRAR